jgi:hypothetical protein
LIAARNCIGWHIANLINFLGINRDVTPLARATMDQCSAYATLVSANLVIKCDEICGQTGCNGSALSS